MASFTYFVVAALLLSSTSRADDIENCPKSCTCNRFTDSALGVQVRVDCAPPSEKQTGPINHIPDDLPPDLTQLLLDNNVIDHLTPNGFSNYPKLKTLSLRGNKIKNVASGTFAGLRQLKDLDLSANDIEMIDIDVFKDVPKLETLSLQRNRLLKIPRFVKFPSITELNFGSNNFTDCTIPSEIPCQKMQKLSLADSDCNSVTESTFTSLVSCGVLKSLVVSNSQVSTISPESFVQLSSLEELDLSANSQLDWSELQKIKFPPRLKKLTLDNLKNVHSVLNTAYINFLPVSLDMLRLSQCGFNGTMPDFRHLTNLTFLYIEENGFTSLPYTNDGSSGFPPSIEHIFARNNKLTSVRAGAFADLQKLQSVDLSYQSKIKPFSRDAFGKIASSVTDLLLTQALGEFPTGLLTSLPNLERLVLDENNFKKLPDDVSNDFDKLTKLQKLDLTGNELQDLPPNFFKRMTSLTHLYLNDNFFGERITKDVDGYFFSGLDSIYLLNLEENDIADLPPKVFSQMGTQLGALDLLGNKLTKFPGPALRNFQKLRVVNLDGNDISRLAPGQFDKVPNNCLINLWTNPIDCGCVNYEFFRWLDQTKANVNRPDIKEVTCGNPPELTGKHPPPVARMTSTCINSANSTAVIVFLVILCLLALVILLAWFGVKKLRHYFPYKRLGQPFARQGGHSQLVTSVPGVNMSGLDDTEETYQM